MVLSLRRQRSTMKNGMRLNNYDGRYWVTSESHFTFQTKDGAWYSIVDQDELFRLDVIRNLTHALNQI